MKIENIVCSGSFNQPLDLRHLSSNCQYIEYGKNKYPGAYIKFNGRSITIYRTGKYIMPGMKSFDDVNQTFEKIKIILDPYLDVSRFSNPEIRNIVCSSDFKQELNLSNIYLELSSRDMDVIYEPEAFPGLILKTQCCTFNIFSSGKFLILGCTSQLQAEDGESMLLDLLE